MFDSASPDTLVEMIGTRLRALARSDQALDEFERTQALSASSVARYLAREMRATDRELENTVSTIIDDVANVGQIRDPNSLVLLREVVEALTATRTTPRGESYPAAVGAALSTALSALRAGTSGDPAISRLQETIRRRLAELADRHVEILSAANDRGRVTSE